MWRRFHEANPVFHHHQMTLRYAVLWLGMWLCVLVGCSTLPDPWPLTSLVTQADGSTWRVAAVAVRQNDQVLLVPYVIITPENAPQPASFQIPVSLSAVQRTQIPWRDDHGIQYAPIILTGVVHQPLRIDAVSELITTLSEASVVSMPRNQLVRVIGLLNTHPDSIYLHDRADPQQFRAFRPAWVVSATPLRLAEDAPVMIEGVRHAEDIVPLVIAPVTTHP